MAVIVRKRIKADNSMESLVPTFIENNIRELYKKFSLLNGFDNDQINKQLLDPDICLFLDLIQEFSDLLQQQLTYQENVLSDKLIQIMAELLFRPRPAVAMFDVGLLENSIKDFSARKGSYLTILSDRQRVQVKCLQDVDKSLSLYNVEVVETKNELSLALNTNKLMTYHDLLDKICRHGLPFTLVGEQNNVCQCLKHLASDNLKEILLVTSIENVSGSNKILSSQKMKIEMGLDLSFDDDINECDTSPNLLYNYFCYQEIYSGFTLLIGNIRFQAERQGFVSNVKLSFRFKEKTTDFLHVRIFLNPLIVAKLSRSQILPTKNVDIDDFPLYLANKLAENEQVYKIRELNFLRSNNHGDEHRSTRNIENDRDIEEQKDWHLFRRIENKRTNYSVSADIHHFVKEPSLLVGEVEVSDSYTGFLPDTDIVCPVNETGEQLITMKLIFQKSGDGWKIPTRLNLSALLNLTKSRQLMYKPKRYINSLLNTSNPDCLYMGINTNIGMACSAAFIKKRKKLIGRKAFISYYLRVVLNKSLSEQPYIVIVAVGLCKQIFSIWGIYWGLTIGVYDIDDQLLISHSNV